MVFLGTSVASGSGRALVIATGMHTEVGRIASGARSERQTVWQIGLFSNRQLWVIIAVSFALQLAISHLPALQQIFGIAPISLRQWSAWIVLGAVPLLVLELRKMVSQAREGEDTPT